ncbi:reverse transcriptase [Tanacetum coccineum]
MLLMNHFWIPLQKGGIIDYCHKFFPAKLQTGYHVYISILLFVILVTEMLLRMIYSLENLRIGLHWKLIYQGYKGVAVLGFVVRFHRGRYLVAGSKRVNFATSVVEAEAKAILWAIQVALAKGFTRVALETNSSILMEAFKHDQVLVPIRAIFLQIRRLCLLFNSGTWSFVRREGNRVAHKLARRALNDSIDNLYDGFVPFSIKPWVQHGVTSLNGFC